MVESTIVFFLSVSFLDEVAIRDDSGRDAVAASSVGPISLLVSSFKVSTDGSIMSDRDEVEIDNEDCGIDDLSNLSFASD